MQELSKSLKLKIYYEHGWVIPFGNTLTQPPFEIDQKTGKGIYLVGDSAGFVNGMTGEGIYFALRSGKELANILNRDIQDMKDYPLFKAKLKKIEKMRDKFRSDYKMDPIKAYNMAIANVYANPEILQWLFADSDKELNLKHYGEASKIEIYRDIIDRLEEE